MGRPAALNALFGTMPCVYIPARGLFAGAVRFTSNGEEFWSFTDIWKLVSLTRPEGWFAENSRMPSEVAGIHRQMFPDDPPVAAILRADAVDTGCFQDAILGVRDHMAMAILVWGSGAAWRGGTTGARGRSPKSRRQCVMRIQALLQFLLQELPVVFYLSINTERGWQKVPVLRGVLMLSSCGPESEVNCLFPWVQRLRGDLLRVREESGFAGLSPDCSQAPLQDLVAAACLSSAERADPVFCKCLSPVLAQLSNGFPHMAKQVGAMPALPLSISLPAGLLGHWLTEALKGGVFKALPDVLRALGRSTNNTDRIYKDTLLLWPAAAPRWHTAGPPGRAAGTQLAQSWPRADPQRPAVSMQWPAASTQLARTCGQAVGRLWANCGPVVGQMRASQGPALGRLRASCGPLRASCGPLRASCEPTQAP